MAKSQRGKAHIKWEVTIKGTYQAKNGVSVTEKPYEISMIMSQAQVDLGAVSQFAQFYAPELMPEKYPDYQNLMTHELKESSCNDEDREKDTLSMMNREKLEAYIEDNDLIVDPMLYKDAGDLRTAIVECEDDTDIFKKQQEILRQRVGTSVQGARNASSFLEESRALNKQKQEEALPAT